MPEAPAKFKYQLLYSPEPSCIPDDNKTKEPVIGSYEIISASKLLFSS
jgi:hypothetical protein